MKNNLEGEKVKIKDKFGLKYYAEQKYSEPFYVDQILIIAGKEVLVTEHDGYDYIIVEGCNIPLSKDMIDDIIELEGDDK